MPVSGGTTLKFRNACCPHLRNAYRSRFRENSSSAFSENASARAEVIDLHGMIDDELHGLERVYAVGISAKRHDRVSHGGKVDDARNAGEVLQQDPRRHERDFLLK